MFQDPRNVFNFPLNNPRESLGSLGATLETTELNDLETVLHEEIY